jgi:hypothetical protein
MVAITFSFRILQVAGGGLLVQMSRVIGTSKSKATVVAIAPLSFDRKAHDVPSDRQGSVRSRRDESGGVCHGVFVEPAKRKSGLGVPKDATESSVNAGCSEFDYNSSDNARDSLQKVDKLSVAGPTFENERWASLPPKPEEPTLKNDSLGPPPPPTSKPEILTGSMLLLTGPKFQLFGKHQEAHE